jgi:hypothetical protein
MSDDRIIEVYRQLRASQDKYIYFLLAAAALALSRTQDRQLSVLLLPWGVALVLWGFSFFFGCRHLAYVSSTLFANAELLRVQRGEHPKAGSNPNVIEAASEGLRCAVDYNSERANLLAKLQFGFFVAGALAYVAWHVLEMYARTGQTVSNAPVFVS